MEAELEKKLKEIGGMLGITEIPDGIGDLVSSFLGAGDGDAETTEAAEAEPDSGGSRPAVGLFSPEREDSREGEETGGKGTDREGINPAALLEIMGKLGTPQKKSGSDKKIGLLRALRPFLGRERQAKVDQCVRLMMLSELAPYLKRLGDL